MRVLLFTGKGGVGKTTTAAATALHLARNGTRVVVTSADPAHSLSDAFGCDLGSDPREVVAHCWAQQLDGRQRLEENWAEISEWLLEVFDRAGVDGVEAEELAVPPGLDELLALSEIETLARSENYDVIVVDCAPTAETIRLLSLPEVLGWYMDRFFPATRRLNRVVGPLISRLSSLPVADDTVVMAGKRFYDRIDSVREILADPGITSVRMVVNPEAMVIAEARRTHTYLSLFGYQVDGIIINRIVPEGPSGEWFDNWRDSQARNLKLIEDSFADIHHLKALHAGAEISGLESLAEFGACLWGDLDPADSLGAPKPMSIEREGEDLVLSLLLPFAEGDEVELSRNGHDLYIAVGPLRRCLTLPDSLARRDVVAAKMDQEFLRIRFRAST